MEEIAEAFGVSRAALFNCNGSLKKGAADGTNQPLLSKGL